MINQNTLNLPTFLMIIAVLIVIGTLFWLWYWAFSERSKLSPQNSRLIATIVIIVLVVFGLISFIALNPKVDSILVLAGLIFFYPSIANIFTGIYLQLFSKLQEQTEYTINGKNGILTKIGSAGLELEKNGRITFIPYTQVLKYGFEYHNTESITEIALSAEIAEGEDQKQIERELQNKILLMPYLSDSKPFQVNVMNQEVFISAWLRGIQFKTSFIESIKKTNLKNIKVN